MWGPRKSSFSVLHSPVGLVDASSIGFHSQIFFGIVSQVQALKVGKSLKKKKTVAKIPASGS